MTLQRHGQSGSAAPQKPAGDPSFSHGTLKDRAMRVGNVGIHRQHVSRHANGARLSSHTMWSNSSRVDNVIMLAISCGGFRCRRFARHHRDYVGTLADFTVAQGICARRSGQSVLRTYRTRSFHRDSLSRLKALPGLPFGRRIFKNKNAAT